MSLGFKRLIRYFMEMKSHIYVPVILPIFSLYQNPFYWMDCSLGEPLAMTLWTREKSLGTACIRTQWSQRWEGCCYVHCLITAGTRSRLYVLWIRRAKWSTCNLKWSTVLFRDRHLSYGRFYSQLKKQECNSREIIKLVTGVMVGEECGNKNV